jgi:hypothetical protein
MFDFVGTSHLKVKKVTVSHSNKGVTFNLSG